MLCVCGLRVRRLTNVQNSDTFIFIPMHFVFFRFLIVCLLVCRRTRNTQEFLKKTYEKYKCFIETVSTFIASAMHNINPPRSETRRCKLSDSCVKTIRGNPTNTVLRTFIYSIRLALAVFYRCCCLVYLGCCFISID